MLDTKRLFKILCTQKFLKMEALGGEIPFFIVDYQPQEEWEVEAQIAALVRKLKTKSINCLVLDLYDLTLELLTRELGEGTIFDIEADMDKDEFKDALQSVLEIRSVLLPAIQAKMDTANAQIYFLKGIGKVYPYIRSHNILNNLQNIALAAPTVIFFPGTYNGESLSLFGRLKDDNYYRAFNFDDYKL